MHQFEFIDPDDTLGRNLAAAGFDAGRSARAALRPAVAADAGPAAASRPAFRRHGGLPGRSVVGRAARKRQHARPRGRAVGQGRLRRHGPHQGRSARPRHDGGAAGRDRPDQPAGSARRRRDTGRRCRACAGCRARRSGASAAGRGGLRDAARGRHHRRVPGRVARADGDAAAAQAGVLLRPRRPGRDRSAPARSSGRWCIRISIAAPAASRWSTTIRCSSRC